jgi:hypothetical protein
MASKPPKTVVILGASYSGSPLFLATIHPILNFSYAGACAAQVIAAGLSEGRRLVLRDRSSYVSLCSLTVPAQKVATGPGFEPENALITPRV